MDAINSAAAAKARANFERAPVKPDITLIISGIYCPSCSGALQDLSGAAALRRSYDAVLFHLLDQARRGVVAYPEPPLEVRGRYHLKRGGELHGPIGPA